MLRRILGFALVALVAIVAFKVAFGLLGLAIGFAVTAGMLAAVGYFGYLVIRVVSPPTAAKIRYLIRGEESPRVPPGIKT